MSQSRVPLGKRSVTHPIREYGGEIFTDYYFGEANTANNSDKHHKIAINENFNWGGISGLLQLATTNRGSRPEIQDDPGEGERSGRRRSQHQQQGTLFHADDKLLSRRLSAERRQRRRTRPSRYQEEERQFEATIRGSTLTQIAKRLGKRTEVNGRP